MANKEKEPSVGAPDSVIKRPQQIIQYESNTNTPEHQEYLKANETKRRIMILQLLKESGSATARELAYRLGFKERNATAPRLTELEAIGAIQVVGTTRDFVTGRKVRVYGIKEE